jgi:hypothetical protein
MTMWRTFICSKCGARQGGELIIDSSCELLCPACTGKPGVAEVRHVRSGQVVVRIERGEDNGRVPD